MQKFSLKRSLNFISHFCTFSQKYGKSPSVTPFISSNRHDVDKNSNAKGVFHENEIEDINILVSNFTAPALARALRERENTLQQVAALLIPGDFDGVDIEKIEPPINSNTMALEVDPAKKLQTNENLLKMLRPYLIRDLGKRKHDESLNLTCLQSSTSGSCFTIRELSLIQRYLNRMPRYEDEAKDSPLSASSINRNRKRASVVIPLCNVNGVASILFERRSQKVRTHKQQVCFPGGMVDEDVDSTIIETSLREMQEELGVPADMTSVLGILRCNWEEVENMTGIAVTPVVCFIGELADLKLTPNPDEVEATMTVPLVTLLEEKNWVTRDFAAPVFTGAPHVIWGLTGYLLDRFLKDVVFHCNNQKEII